MFFLVDWWPLHFLSRISSGFQWWSFLVFFIWLAGIWGTGARHSKTQSRGQVQYSVL